MIWDLKKRSSKNAKPRPGTMLNDRARKTVHTTGLESLIAWRDDQFQALYTSDRTLKRQTLVDQSNVYTVLLHIGWEGEWEWTGLNSVLAGDDLLEILTPPLPLPSGLVGWLRDPLERCVLHRLNKVRLGNQTSPQTSANRGGDFVCYTSILIFQNFEIL